MLFVDNIQRHIYKMKLYINPAPCFPLSPPVLHLSTPLTLPLFTYLENQLFLLVVQIPIHSCPWFAINCSPLAASPTPRHPTDQVTYLHRWHQQHQLSRLIQFVNQQHGAGEQVKVKSQGQHVDLLLCPISIYLAEQEGGEAGMHRNKKGRLP
jgi:hypothetical protein